MSDLAVHYVQDIKLAAALLAVGMAPREPVETAFVERISNNGQPPRDWFYFKANPLIKHYVKAWESREDFYTAQDETLGMVTFGNDHRFWSERLALRNRERILDKIMRPNKILFMMEKYGRIYIFTKENDEH